MKAKNSSDYGRIVFFQTASVWNRAHRLKRMLYAVKTTAICLICVKAEFHTRDSKIADGLLCSQKQGVARRQSINPAVTTETKMEDFLQFTEENPLDHEL